jgi:hypothetical protein
MTTPTEPTPPSPDAGTRRRVLLITGAVVVVLVLVAVGVILATRGDDVTTTGTTTSTAAPGSTSTVTSTSTSTTSTSTSSVTTSTSTPGIVTDEESATIVWPDPEGGIVYTTATAAVEGFAVDLVGFTDPVVGELQQGDSRSGEIELRPAPPGPVTTVLVRQMGDDHWYVIGSSTPDIVVDDPIAGTAIDAPLVVAGQALAFEGTVNVSVVERGATDPLGEGIVTGSGGGELAPFSGQIDWANPGGGRGSVLFWTVSAEDGSVMQVTAIPVGFIGGD